jgi:hypothetical protein
MGLFSQSPRPDLAALRDCSVPRTRPTQNQRSLSPTRRQSRPPCLGQRRHREDPERPRMAPIGRVCIVYARPDARPDELPTLETTSALERPSL